MTDAKSTPKTRANSLDCQLCRSNHAMGNIRVLGNDLSPVDELNIHDHTLKVIFEHPMSMFKSLALP